MGGTVQLLVTRFDLGSRKIKCWGLASVVKGSLPPSDLAEALNGTCPHCRLAKLCTPQVGTSSVGRRELESDNMIEELCESCESLECWQRSATIYSGGSSIENERNSKPFLAWTWTGRLYGKDRTSTSA